MNILKILPGVLKELIKHVPTAIFDVVEWSAIANEIPKLTGRLLKKQGYEEIFELQKLFLQTFNINLIHELKNHNNLDKTSFIAEQILSLYFSQLLSPHGVFLDLRASHFSFENLVLNFKPSGLWVKFNERFSEGLIQIYDGFYMDDDQLFHAGLLKSGLTSLKWEESDRDKLAALFKAHFGDSVATEMSFELEAFKSSFIKIADFLLEKKVKISVDFLYLGIALVTLYSSLEATHSKVNVKKIYLATRNQS